MYASSQSPDGSPVLSVSKPLNIGYSLQVGNDSPSEVAGRRVASHIHRADLAIVNDIVGSGSDVVGDGVETQMTKHHCSRQDHSSRVRHVFTHDILGDVSAARLEDSVVSANVATRNDTWTADEGSTDVGDNSAVQIGHDHDVELLRLRYQLHGSVIDDHVIELDARRLILLGDLAECVQEQTVTKLHDVSFVDAGDFLAAILLGKVECKADDTFSLVPGTDFQALDNAGIALMFQTRVFSLSVLSDDGKVYVVVASWEAGQGLAQYDRGVDVELLSHGDVP